MFLSEGSDLNVALNMASSDDKESHAAMQLFSSQLHYMQFCSSRVDLVYDKVASTQPRPLSAIPADYMPDNFGFPPSSDEVYSGFQTNVQVVNSFSNQYAGPAVRELQPPLLTSGIKNVKATKFLNALVSVQEDDSSKYFAANRDIFKHLTEEIPDNCGGQTSKGDMKLVLHSTDTKDRTAKISKLRRTRVAERLKALQCSVPCLNQGKKDSELDDVIDYIKFLKLQLKVLSRSRLSGEATSSPFVFMEGYGHYLICQDKCDEPLEETMSQLMESDMQAATNLLESKGLVILPMASACATNQAS